MSTTNFNPSEVNPIQIALPPQEPGESQKDYVKRCHGLFKSAAESAGYCDVEDSGESTGAKEESLPLFPKISGSIAELSEALAPDVPLSFKVMSAVTRVGLAISGSVVLENERHLQPRFYVVEIAAIGTGKTAAVKETRIIQVGYTSVPSVDSAPALVDAFKEAADAVDGGPARLLLTPDEAIDLFEKAKMTPSGRNSLFSELLKLYEDNSTGNRARSSESGPIDLENAHLAILSGATPDGYRGMWVGSRGMSGGLQSRFALVVEENAPKMPATQRPSDVAKVKAAVERIHRQIVESHGAVLKITPEAAAMLDEWWKPKSAESASTARAVDMVKRFAMVLAVTNDTDTIDVRLMKMALAFGDHLIAAREKYNPADASSWVHQFENRIIDVHRKKGAPLTMNDVRRAIRPDRCSGGYGDFNRAHGNLVRGGKLVRHSESRKGEPRYVLAED